MRSPAFLLLILASCTSGETPIDTPPPAADSTMMPLAVGNSWVMRTTHYDTAGTAYFTRLDTTLLVETDTVGGIVWYMVVGGGRYRNDSRGLIWSDNLPIALWPAQPGDTFRTATVMATFDTTGPVPAIAGMEVVSTDTLITVPAGTFRCYHYRYAFFTPPMARHIQSASSYYAPGVGRVLSEQRQWLGTGTSDYGPITMQSVLVSYTLH